MGAREETEGPRPFGAMAGLKVPEEATWAGLGIPAAGCPATTVVFGTRAPGPLHISGTRGEHSQEYLRASPRLRGAQIQDPVDSKTLDGSLLSTWASRHTWHGQSGSQGSVGAQGSLCAPPTLSRATVHTHAHMCRAAPTHRAPACHEGTRPARQPSRAHTKYRRRARDLA